jgi:integrase
MNDLIISNDLLENLPNIKEGIRKAKHLFDEVKNFEDLERTFLRGEGLSAGTYRVYLQSVKCFYQFTEGRHPFQVRPADIEAWYDSMSELDLATRYNRIMGLKRFFTGIEKQVPFFLSPFQKMSEKLKSKLYAAKKGRKKVKALTIQEVKRILREYPAVSVRETEDLAIFFFLISSGLRSFELLQLRWRDIEEYDGTLYAGFTQKGGKVVQQELYRPAVEAAREYFKAQFKR